MDLTQRNGIKPSTTSSDLSQYSDLPIKAIQEGFKRGGITDPFAVNRFLDGLLKIGTNLGYQNPQVFRKQALNLMKLESGFNPSIRNTLGYKGLIQFSPNAQKTYQFSSTDIQSQLNAIERYLKDNQKILYKTHGQEVMNRDLYEDGSLVLTSVFTGPASKGLKDPSSTSSIKDAYGTSVATYYNNIVGDRKESGLEKIAKSQTTPDINVESNQSELDKNKAQNQGINQGINPEFVQKFAEYYKAQQTNTPETEFKGTYANGQISNQKANVLGYKGNQGYQGQPLPQAPLPPLPQPTEQTNEPPAMATNNAFSSNIPSANESDIQSLSADLQERYAMENQNLMQNSQNLIEKSKQAFSNPSPSVIQDYGAMYRKQYGVS